MTEYFILLVLFVALVAYSVVGGADFGVGIIEMLSPRRERRAVRKLSEHAIGPIWEANHVWIILVLVILFVGFPSVHSDITTRMHVPLLVMLVGIVLRGAAFTFRYYDLAEDVHSERLWTWLFRAGSALVPISFGVISAGLYSDVPSAENPTVWQLYVAPWCTLSGLVTGVFVASLFAWVASVFLCGEPETKPERAAWIRRAHRFGILCAALGALSSGTAILSGTLRIADLVAPVPIASITLATLASGAVFAWVGKRPWLARGAMTIVVAAILGGYWLAHYPVAVHTQHGALTWKSAIAPQATQDALSLALVIGLLLIGPALTVLYRVFKRASE